MVAFEYHQKNMKELKSNKMYKLQLLAALFLATSCSTYSEQFVQNYITDDWEDVRNESILVFPQKNGYCFEQNSIIRQIEYSDYSKLYHDYSSFLLNLLNGNVDLGYENPEKIYRFDRLPNLTKPFFMNKYLKKIGDSNEYSIYGFKQTITKEKELGIVKMMFDSGYYVLRSDYSAEYLFLQIR